METVLAPLDALRVLILRVAGPAARPVIGDREMRVAFTGLVTIASSLVLVVLWPPLSLAIAALIFGIPHLAADLAQDVTAHGLDISWSLGLVNGLRSPWDVRLLGLFAFAQAVHYGIWLPIGASWFVAGRRP